MAGKDALPDGYRGRTGHCRLARCFLLAGSSLFLAFRRLE
jgi:hypothetical protein